MAKIFAYGSNMCLERMRLRVASAEVLGVARLAGHCLRFHKLGRDGSGKADAFFTGRGEDAVWGVVYAVADGDVAALDLLEGLGRDYFAHDVTVVGSATVSHDARLYTASPQMIDGRLLPFSWYKRLVMEGARGQGLPPDYLAMLEGTGAWEDPDRQRHQSEIAVVDGRAKGAAPIDRGVEDGPAGRN